MSKNIFFHLTLMSFLLILVFPFNAKGTDTDCYNGCTVDGYLLNINDVSEEATKEATEAFNDAFLYRTRTLVPYPTGDCPTARGSATGCYAPENAKKAGTMFNNDIKRLKDLGFCREDISIPCNYTLCDAVQLFINITRLLMGVIGGIVLLFFMYAALLFITAQGSSEQITKARKVMRSAVTGLIIVMVSYQLVGYILLIILNKNLLSDDGPRQIDAGILQNNWDDLSTLRANCKGIKNNKITN